MPLNASARPGISSQGRCSRHAYGLLCRLRQYAGSRHYFSRLVDQKVGIWFDINVA